MDPINPLANNQSEPIAPIAVINKVSFKDKIFGLPIFLKILFLLILVGIIGFGYLIFVKSSHQVTSNNVTILPVLVKSAQAATYFTVVSVTPSDKSINNAEDTPIKITFSQPVRPD